MSEHTIGIVMAVIAVASYGGLLLGVTLSARRRAAKADVRRRVDEIAARKKLDLDFRSMDWGGRRALTELTKRKRW